MKTTFINPQKATPDPTIPTAWFSWDYGDSIQLEEDFKIQRFFKIDPPTPRVKKQNFKS